MNGIVIKLSTGKSFRRWIDGWKGRKKAKLWVKLRFVSYHSSEACNLSSSDDRE